MKKTPAEKGTRVQVTFRVDALDVEFLRRCGIPPVEVFLDALKNLDPTAYNACTSYALRVQLPNGQSRAYESIYLSRVEKYLEALAQEYSFIFPVELSDLADYEELKKLVEAFVKANRGLHVALSKMELPPLRRAGFTQNYLA